ncbi:MAG TPA: AmmeMemoRadiSam system protein B [Terriglobia bacterium]|nr:AmmeMemoRadiSam system protein B [Terriglobia bacterium]
MEPPSVRSPAVAGRFYPQQREALLRDVDGYLQPESGDQARSDSAAGCVVPHAGYIYSGHVAGAVYRLLPARSRYVILGPNHRARGAPLAVMSQGCWLTPLGAVEVDTELAGHIRERCPVLAEDPEAHEGEHSIEVQLPFLQRTSAELRFVPIALAVADYDLLEQLGVAIAEASRLSMLPTLIVASSDLNHYEPDIITRQKDDRAIAKILQLDPAGLLEVIRDEDISMCGYAPTIAMLAAARALGAREACLIRHATSADTGGDKHSVVGYAGIIVD